MEAVSLERPLARPGPLRSRIVENDAWVKAALLFFASFLAYWLTRSAGLDEVDSGNFALGVQHFNLWQHQPHPPGYPLYIFLGRLGCGLLGLDPVTSLHLVAAVGGGFLIASWFLIIRVQFNERLAWWVAICLAITPAIWMTATKVLSDTLAAGLLSGEIFAGICFIRSGMKRALVAIALFGAAAAGVRPQLFLVVFTVLGTALVQGPRVPRKSAVLAWLGLIGAGLCWLIPMWYIQSRLKPHLPVGSVYPQLVYTFWAGRLHSPQMYLFAGDWSPKYLAIRCTFHFLGWFGVGFGFLQSWPALIVGTLVSLAGIAAYVFMRKDAGDKRFWKFHTPWAVVHIAGIFISVTASQRYYVVVFPLLLVLLLRDLLRLRAPWNAATFVLPAVLLLTTVPIVIANHRDEAPPMRFIRYLQQLYPPEQRHRVVLLLSTQTKRQADWYAPDFKLVSPIPPPDKMEEITKDAAAVYTDNPWAQLPNNWYRVPLNGFGRSVIIYWKSHYLELYLIDRQQGR